MTASAELDELRRSLRRALGTPAVDVAPELDLGWLSRWPALAELGITAFCVPESAGGFGTHVPAAVVAGCELGAVLHSGPFAAATAAAFAISRGLDDRDRVVERLISGEAVAVLSLLEPNGTVVDGPNGPSVDGRARLVVGGDEADAFVVVAPDHKMMVYVWREACSTTPSTLTLDVSRSCADVQFSNAPAVAITSDAAAVSLAVRLHNLLTAADALGGVERMLDRTVAYARDRIAFGRPIGGFQAVQHRLVDHTLQVRGLSLLVTVAAEDLAAGAGMRRALLAEAAVAKHAVHVLHDLLQLTGAIGFTWEHGLHLYERRAHLDARLASNPRSAIRALAALEGWPAAGS